jgi:hypothetical protein
MEFNELDNLIKKYFDGISSMEEEVKIRQFFNKSINLPEKYERIKQVFLFYQNERNAISELRIDTIIPKKDSWLKIKKISYYTAAACILLLAGIWFVSNKAEQKPVYAYINGKPVENKEIAYEEAQKALMLVSKNLNKGAKKVNTLSEFNKAMSIIGTK